MAWRAERGGAGAEIGGCGGVGGADWAAVVPVCVGEEDCVYGLGSSVEGDELLGDEPAGADHSGDGEHVGGYPGGVRGVVLAWLVAAK